MWLLWVEILCIKQEENETEEILDSDFESESPSYYTKNSYWLSIGIAWCVYII